MSFLQSPRLARRPLARRRRAVWRRGPRRLDLRPGGRRASRSLARWLIMDMISRRVAGAGAMPRYKKSYDGERRTRRRIILLTPGENRQLEKSAEAGGAQLSEPC